MPPRAPELADQLWAREAALAGEPGAGGARTGEASTEGMAVGTASRDTETRYGKALDCFSVRTGPPLRRTL